MMIRFYGGHFLLRKYPVPLVFSYYKFLNSGYIFKEYELRVFFTLFRLFPDPYIS
jgi:hypothetical protein